VLLTASATVLVAAILFSLVAIIVRSVATVFAKPNFTARPGFSVASEPPLKAGLQNIIVHEV
jgi:hypothetical protein